MPRKPSDIPNPTGQAFDALVPDWPADLKSSAQQVWLAGLGALAKAQAEGGKALETLIQDGLAVQRKTQAQTQERMTEATQRLSGVAAELSSRASGQWDKLEGLFETRVAKALHHMGVPLAADLQALSARIEALEQQVQAQATPRRTRRPSASAQTEAAPAQPVAAARRPRKKPAAASD